MLKLLLLCFIVTSPSWAQVGKILKVIGTEGMLLRESTKDPLKVDVDLNLGDTIDSGSSIVQILIYPATQISLSKNTQIKLKEHYISENKLQEKAYSAIGFIKGLIRVNVTKSKDQDIDQKYDTDVVSFAVRGTEFELSDLVGDEVGVDVVEGIVEASSPYVQSFVPEIIKESEGLGFSRKKKGFLRRKFNLRFRDHPGFSRGSDLLKKWQDMKRKKRRKSMKDRKKRKDR